MRRLLAFMACALSLLALTSSTAAGAGPYLVGDPTFSDLGTALQANGVVGGADAGPVALTLTAKAYASAVCANQGGNAAPGRQRIPVTVSVTVTSPEATLYSDSPDAYAVYSVQTLPPPDLTWDQAGCANSNWTASVTDLDFTSAEIGLEQDSCSIAYWFCLWRYCF